MDQILDKKSLFLRPEISDFAIIIGDQRLDVHKSVLMSSSEYFSALFNSEMIETKTKEISLKETLIKPFLIVLKLSYDIVITDEEWLELKIQELFESIITANKYQFVECERQLSHKLIHIFAYKVSEMWSQWEQTDTSMLTIWELLEMAKLHNLMFLIELCLTFFDENISYAFKTFDNQFISADILLDVISRDTFGASEVTIFEMVQKWVNKYRIRSNRKCIEETLLLESVRLTLMSLHELHSIVLKSGLYETEVIERIAKHELSGDLAQNNRICYESGKQFTINCVNDLHLRNEQSVVVCVNCILPMPSKINHLMFTLKPIDRDLKVNANYWIGIADSKAENGFRKILDYNQYSCIGEQDLYFDEPFVTNSIRILLECSVDSRPTIAEPELEPTHILTNSGRVQLAPSPPRQSPNWRRSRTRLRREYRDPKLLNVNSLSYEYSKSPLKTMESCIVADANMCQKFGAECHCPYFGHRFDAYLSETVLNNTRVSPFDASDILDAYEFRSIDSITEVFSAEKIPKMSDDSIGTSLESVFRRQIQKAVKFQDPSSDYLIRLTQPIFADCLQFELILENEKSSKSDECLSAECKVEICPSFANDWDSGNWTEISEDSYLTESGFYNLEFELQKVSVIKISGFRYNSERSLKYALHLKNFSIPADRQSWSWTSGSKLGNETNIIALVNNIADAVDDGWN